MDRSDAELAVTLCTTVRILGSVMQPPQGRASRHDGHPWNDLADVCASSGVVGSNPNCVLFFAVSGLDDVQNPAAEATARDGATPRVNPRYNHRSHHGSAPRASPQDNSKCYFRTDGRAAQCHGQTPVTLSQRALDWRSRLACSRNFPSWGRFARTARSRSRLGHLPFLTPSFLYSSALLFVKLSSEGSCSVLM